MRRYDYAVFADDRHVHNAMLTREEAERLEAEGYRCIDVAASMDPAVPRFRERRYGWSRSTPRHWER